MKQLCKQLAGAAGILFILAACGESNSNYPQEYVGFDKTVIDYSVNKNSDTEELDIKIVAADKKNEDREVLISGINKPGQTAVFSLEDRKVIVPAKKKSATVRVTLYPKRVTNSAEFRLVCTPQDKDAKKTQITIRLTAK